MAKYKDSNWHRIREYVSFEITGDIPKQFVVGVTQDGRELFPNICYFAPDDKEKLPYFYVNRRILKNDANPEYEKSLTSLELFSKSHDPPFYIRSLFHDRIFAHDALQLFPIALQKQGYSTDVKFLHEFRETVELEKHIYQTIPEEEFWNMLDTLDIDKSNIVIVPDVQQLYRYAHSEWELPDIVFAPDGDAVIGSQHAVFYIFQLLLCWKRDECSNCSHDNFENEVLKIMSIFEEFHDSVFLPQKYVVFQFAKLLSKLCSGCMGKYPKSMSPPLPDKSFTDKISITELKATMEKYGVPDRSGYEKLSTLVIAMYCPVWMVRLFMIGGWFRKVLPKMDEKVKESLLSTVEYLMPQYLREHEQKEEFLKFVMLGSMDDRFTKSKDKARSRAEALRIRKEIRKKNCWVVKNQNESGSYDEDGHFQALAVKLLVKETAEKDQHRKTITEGVWKKPSKEEKSEDIGTDGDMDGERSSTAVEKEGICENEMSKPPELNVVRHTRYAEIQEMKVTITTEDSWSVPVGKLEDGTQIYPNLECFAPKAKPFVKDFFYFNWMENKEKIDNDRNHIMRMSNLEEFAKAYNPTTLYIRCLDDGVVFLNDLLKILRIASQNDQITEKALLKLLGQEDMVLSSTEFYSTIHVDFLLKMVDILEIDPKRIVIVPDILQQRASAKCELSFGTHAPDTIEVMSFDQAVFFTFQEAFCWKGIDCEKNCQKSMEKIIALHMDNYVKMEKTFYKSTLQILYNLNDTYKKYLCQTCLASKYNAPQHPFAAKKHDDKILFSELLELKTAFGVPIIWEPHIQKRTKNQESIFVWKAKLIMFVEWTNKALSSLNAPILDSIYKIMKLFVPFEIRNDPNQSDYFIKAFLSGWRAVTPSQVSKTSEGKKSIKPDANCAQQKGQKENIVENNMDALLETIAKLEGRPANSQGKKLTKNMFDKENIEVLETLTKKLKQETSELDKVKAEINRHEEYKYRHTKITELDLISFKISSTGKARTFVGYGNELMVVTNQNYVTPETTASEYFYVNIPFGIDIMKNPLPLPDIYRPPFILRALKMEDDEKVVFVDEVEKLIPIALSFQKSHFREDVYQEHKELWKAENYIFKTMSVTKLVQILDQLDIDKTNIFVVRDFDQPTSCGDFELPFTTISPSNHPVISQLQVIWNMFQLLVFWKKRELRKRCRCRKTYEQMVVNFMEAHVNMNQTTFVLESYCDMEIKACLATLCEKCHRLACKIPRKPLLNHDPNDTISYEVALRALEEYTGPDDKLMKEFCGEWKVHQFRKWMVSKYMSNSFISKNEKVMKRLEVARLCLLPLENSEPEDLPVPKISDEPKQEKQTPELKYQNTKINRFEEIIGFQQGENEEILIAVYAENVKIRANICAFQPDEQVSEYFYGNCCCLERARGLKQTAFGTLEKYSEAVNDLFYIRTMGGWKDPDKRIFADEVRRVIPLALKRQGCEAEKTLLAKLKDLWKSENDHTYITISVDEFLETLDRFDVDKRNIALVPDHDQVYALNFFDWILPFSTFAPDFKPVFAPLQIAFVIFEKLVFWRKIACREECGCREAFEKAVLDKLESFADMDQTQFLSVVHCFITQLITLLCPECFRLYPDSFIKPLPNHNSTDKVSYPEALYAYAEFFGFFGPNHQQMYDYIKQRGSWMVCHLRFFIFGRLLHTSFVKKNQKVVEFLEKASLCLVPKKHRDDKKFLMFLTEVYKSGSVPEESEKGNSCAALKKKISQEQNKEPKVPEEEARVKEPEIPVPQKKKEWIVPKNKRPDPPYKQNRKNRKKSKRAAKSEDSSPVKRAEIVHPETSPPPEPATESAPKNASEPAPEFAPESAPELPKPSKDDEKLLLLANVRKELQEAKHDLSTLRAQNQKNEGLELKVKKLQEEKRQMKEAYELEKRGLEQQHSVLVKHLTENLGNLKTKLADQTNTANEKIQVLEVKNQKLSNPRTREKMIQDQKDKEIEELRRALSQQRREVSNLRNQLSQEDTKQTKLENENLQLKNEIKELRAQKTQEAVENVENQEINEQIVALSTRNHLAEDRIFDLVEELSEALQLDI